MDYLFEYAKTKAREHGYGGLSEHEKWDWHADIYGFRRVFCDASPAEHSSPCDPFGRWFDEGRAALAEAHYQAIRDDGRRHRDRAVGAALYAAE